MRKKVSSSPINIKPPQPTQHKASVIIQEQQVITPIYQSPYQTPIVQTVTIVKQENPVQLLEEVRLLKLSLQQKDSMIDKLSNEKQELVNKLAKIDTYNTLLVSDLLQDKMELKEKVKLVEIEKTKLKIEITELQHDYTINLVQKDSEIEILKKEFAEFTNVSLSQSNGNEQNDGQQHTEILILENKEMLVKPDEAQYVSNNISEMTLLGNDSNVNTE